MNPIYHFSSFTTHHLNVLRHCLHIRIPPTDITSSKLGLLTYSRGLHKVLQTGTHPVEHVVLSVTSSLYMNRLESKSL